MYGYTGFEVQDRVYVINGDKASFEMDNVVANPSLSTVIITPFTIELVIEASPGVYSIDPSGVPPYLIQT